MKSPSGIDHTTMETSRLQHYIEECIAEAGEPCWICKERQQELDNRKNKEG